MLSHWFSIFLIKYLKIGLCSVVQQKKVSLFYRNIISLRRCWCSGWRSCEEVHHIHVAQSFSSHQTNTPVDDMKLAIYANLSAVNNGSTLARWQTLTLKKCDHRSTISLGYTVSCTICNILRDRELRFSITSKHDIIIHELNYVPRVPKIPLWQAKQ